MKVCKPGIFLIILLFVSVSCLQKQSLEWFPFNWEGDTISGKYIEKAFLYIPVKIDNLPHEFTMQLDLAMGQTVFYGNSIDPYLKEYASLADKYKAPMFNNITLQMGSVKFKSIEVGYYNNFGEEIPQDSLHSKSPKHIGTIGSDLFQNKILVIDYKSCRLAVTDSLPKEYKNLPAERFELKDGVIKIPFHINGKECKLMFDTGSSPFQLVTSKERALEISDSIITDSLSGPLWWGKEITFYGLMVNKPVRFGKKAFKSSKVYYDKVGLWNEIYDYQKVWGITGNAYFLDNIVIIDYKNKLFRVK
ncbi:hypothetical protein [Parabacteroides pacaensis]|uniref:hypothetical protein n=1 Tax=Parabacteroides pacaensis TaxID=2086575 RepID=UPI000D1132D8|nr:hypothetical protein [Parabacteroides pacaensis]